MKEKQIKISLVHCGIHCVIAPLQQNVFYLLAACMFCYRWDSVCLDCTWDYSKAKRV